MPVHNAEIADLFDQLADLLDIEEANAFRIRAYRNAARTIRANPKSMADLLGAGADLSELPGIGKDLAGKIETIVGTGRLPLLEEVASRTPRVLSELLRIPGLGPKRVKTLYRALKVRSVEDLKRAAAAGRIRQLPGFGEKTERSIRSGIEQLARHAGRIKLATAEDIAATLVAYLKKCAGIKEVTLAGSYRRRKETVGDLDILVTGSRSSRVVEHFVAYDEVAEIVSKGATRSTVRLRSGLHVDLRVVPQVSYGAALHYFTGSKAHNIAVRKIGIKKGYKINEYGVFRDDRRLAGRTETEVFAKVGLSFIPPELREDRGEIEAARARRLPELISLADIRGDLHCHTTASDGRDTLERIAAAAVERGYEYVSINDHSKHVTIAHGLDEKRVFAQIEANDKLNRKLDGISVLKSIELDILENGSLDLPDRVLKELDFTVCAVHYQFGLSERRQTERVLRAMDNRYFTILAHPTGRLINERQPYSIDLERIMQGAKERGCLLELNAHPDRLDLTDEACRLAKDMGVQVAISTDAHQTGDLAFMKFGIDQARRGWLTANDVVNTRGLDGLRTLLKRR
jgi:DNA polymerase (family 10)